MGRKTKTLTLTNEHIALISNIKFEKFVFDDKQHYLLFKSMVNELKLSDDKDYSDINDNILNRIYNFEPQSRFGWGCDQWGLFGGTYVLEDIAMILGYYDQAIENSENMASGRRFPKEIEDKMYSLYDFICENMDDIMNIVFSHINKGGLSEGTYEFKDGEWKFLNIVDL